MHAFLPRKLHHHQTTGGKEENAKFEDQYLATLRFYREVFGEDAPADIWADPTKKPTLAPTQIADVWTIRKPQRSSLVLGALVGMALLAVGCRATDGLALSLGDDCAADLLGCGLRLGRGVGDDAGQYRHSVGLEQIPGLVLVQIHVALAIALKGGDERSAVDVE